MMNKYTIIFTLLFFFSYSVTAQVCIPDPIYTDEGVHPDTLEDAFIGVAYSQVLTVIVPYDTTVSGQQVIIDSIVLKEVIGKPTWLGIQCEPSGCAFPGDSTGCGLLSGTPPAGSAGSYPLDLVLTSYGKVSGVFSIVQTDTLKAYYTLNVSAGSGITKIPWSESVKISPIPAVNQVKLDFAINVVKDMQLEVYDILGNRIFDDNYTAMPGNNSYMLNTSKLSSGTYLLVMSEGNNRIIRKFMIHR